MRSTFMGLEISKRGMFTQQGALHTTGNNIANVNTPGYSRQRINFEATTPYPSIGMSRPQIPGQMGTGVQAGSVQRIREGFLDTQYRQENNKLGYWESRANALEKMEEIMNEPSDAGLSKTLDRFWQSLQDLAINPTNAGARSVVRERGIAVADTFKYLSKSLNQIQNDLKTELNVSKDELNSIANQLNSINKQISEIEPHGYLPNDLYDQRDLLLDKLSSLVNIKVTNHPSGGNALKIAEGIVTVEIVDDSGKSLGTLVDGEQQSVNELSIGYAGEEDGGLVQTISIGTDEINILDFNSMGKISSLIDSYGYGDQEGLFTNMLNKLDVMAFDFAKEFNKIHNEGLGLTLEAGTDKLIIDKDNRYNFFSFGTDGSGTDIMLSDSKGAAGLIQISKAIKDSTNHIAASLDSADTTAGNGGNALKLAEVKNNPFMIDGTSTTFQNYYEGVIGGMAVNAQEAERLSGNSMLLRDSVDQRRQSVSAVSLDEEMTNMIQFQHAYNASARMITLQDEILDKIINGMGLSR
ncbi:flagellar hook-associated protein FlgK [Metabacillus fastidiosus]|uniref:flagellar hook-associated protein FlgK n=1 Tax=Metabacillus fastidiosus TaxID=1458 RepID=UPI002E2158C3|nr:flagellar hook-associated protein FlgK [Metabacillus fastidiosus]MED4454453.1 flagellar hook-associated protein FlgK [Metabacillus fastidiosus]